MQEMTLHQLKIFQTIAGCLNITRAAKELRISQPSISKQLKLLEEECGVKFHVRIGRGIQLTDQGLLFRDAVRPILDQIDRVRKSFATASKCLTVGGSQSPSASLLPEVLNAFTQTHRDVETVLRTSDSRCIEELVLKGDVEVGVVTNPSHRPQLIEEPFRSEEVIAVVSTRHLLSRKCKLTQEELAKVPVLARLDGRTMAELARIGLTFQNIVMRCESLEVKRAAVEAGLGLGFFYRDTVDLALRRGHLRALTIPRLKEIDIKCFIVYRKEVPLSRNAQEFISQLRCWPIKCGVKPHSRAGLGTQV